MAYSEVNVSISLVTSVRRCLLEILLCTTGPVPEDGSFDSSS